MLIVGKRNSLYKVTGDPTTKASSLAVVPIYTKDSDSTGFTSPWAIAQVGNDVIYLDGFDIKRLSGIQEYGDIESASVIPHFKDYLQATVDKDYLQYAQFFHYKQKQQLWCSIPTGAATHLVFALDYRFKEVTKRYSFFPMGSLAANCLGGIESGTVLDLYMGDETGFVHQLDTGNDDNGVAITRYFVTSAAGNVLSDTNPITTGHEMRKQFQKSETHILSEQAALTMTPSYALNLMNDAQVRTSGNYTNLTAEVVTGSTWAGTGVKRKRLRFWGLNGKVLALKWTHAALAQNFTFYPSELHFDWKSGGEII